MSITAILNAYIQPRYIKSIMGNGIYAQFCILSYYVIIIALFTAWLGYVSASTQHSFAFFQYDNSSYALLEDYGNEKIAIGGQYGKNILIFIFLNDISYTFEIE